MMYYIHYTLGLFVETKLENFNFLRVGTFHIHLNFCCTYLPYLMRDFRNRFSISVAHTHLEYFLLFLQLNNDLSKNFKQVWNN